MWKEHHNIEIRYIYRDGENNKRKGTVIFWNPHNHSVETVMELLRGYLLHDFFFTHAEWKVPSLFFDSYDPELDHTWHEFESAEISKKPSTEMRTIDQFIEELGISSEHHYES